MRTIFISHSAKSRDDISDLDAIAEGLVDAGFEIWLDRQCLQAADDWNQKIGNHLVYCQGAVVLVSKASLASPYVQHEISNLLLRWRREKDPATGEPRFPLCPVLLSHDVVDALEQGFTKAIGFKDVNYVGPCRGSEALPKLIRTFKGLPDFAEVGSPLAALEQQIADVLGHNPKTLRIAAKEAGFPVPPGVNDEAAAIQVAQSLLTRPLADGYEFLDRLGATLLNEQRLNLFHLIAPGWVSHEAARKLADAFATQPPPACILNAEIAVFTPEMYLRRARLELPNSAGRAIGVKGVTVSLAWDQLRHLVAVALAHDLRMGTAPSEADFEAKLKDEISWYLQKKKRPIVVAVPVAEADLDLIATLRADPTFTGVTFVALCKTAVPSDQPSDLVWLDPALQPDQEDRAHAEYDRFLKWLA